MTTPFSDQVYEAVREHYGQIASTRDTSSECCGPDACGCADDLYSTASIAGLPPDVTGLSLGCGDPVSLADIRQGDTVLDLGSGGGIDCFLAASRVGPAGRVIGVDMTPEMLERARANALKLNAANVEFRQGQIEALPVENDTVDMVLSNCVINLAPDKSPVFREMFRVLRSGGRVSVSDIVTHGPMSPLVAQGLEAWAGCVSGALDVSDYRAGLETAGFVDVTITPKGDASIPGVVGPTLASIPAGLPFSALISARKP